MATWKYDAEQPWKPSPERCPVCGTPTQVKGVGPAGVVWLCTDCADALADVVNERRAVEKADNPADTDPERALSFEEADELWG